MNSIIDRILSSNNIMVCAHVSPDGDAIGSSLGLAGAIKSLGKNVFVNMPEFPTFFNYLKLSELVYSGEQKDYDLVIVVDTSSIDRISFGDYVFDKDKTIVIDHHATNSLYGSANYVDSNSSSCCEIIYELISKMNIDITLDIGESLLTGILTDTNGYLNSNVNSRTLDISSKLVSLGVDIHNLYYKVLVSISRVSFELRKRVYNRLEFFNDNRIAFSYLTNYDIVETGATTSDYEGMVEIGRSVEGVQVSVFVRETELGYKVSIRSIPGVSSADIAAIFGGGGHVCASGCLINDCLDNVREKLIKTVGEFLI